MTTTLLRAVALASSDLSKIARNVRGGSSVIGQLLRLRGHTAKAVKPQLMSGDKRTTDRTDCGRLNDLTIFRLASLLGHAFVQRNY